MSEHINVSPNLESAMPFTQEWYGDADSVISAADEQDILEAQERWELSKLKKKYERVAEKDEC